MTTRDIPHVPLEREIDTIVARLEERFHAPHDEVEHLVHDSAERLQRAPIQQFIPLLAEKRARRVLGRNHLHS